MPATPEEIAHVRDLFAGLGDVTTGRLFSGTSFYVEGDVMFACFLDGTLYMKSDDNTRAQFEAAGSAPFAYAKATGEQVVTSLMSLPDSAYDDPAEALDWARLAYGPALAAAEKKRREKARKAAKA